MMARQNPLTTLPHRTLHPHDAGSIWSLVARFDYVGVAARGAVAPVV